MQSGSRGGLVTVPRHFGKLGAYGILGIGFYRRSVSLEHAQPLEPLTICQPAWRWWDLTCVNGAIQAPQSMSSNSKDAGGFNYGGGLTYRLKHLHDSKVYIEGPYQRAYHSDGKHLVMPIT